MTEAAAPLTIHVEKISADQAAAHRKSLYAWLEQLQEVLTANPNTVLMSRKDAHFLWRQTGFLVENGIVFAKLGEKHYQPIGKDDGVGFYPTSASKLFWAQDFQLARLHAYEPAFKVEHLQPHKVDQGTDGQALTDHEYAVMVDNFKAIQEYIQKYNGAQEEGEKTAFESATSDLLDILKIACIQCPKLDARLVQFGIENPELGLTADLSGNFKIIDLASVASEWLRLKINDEAARRHDKATVLMPTIDPNAVNLDDDLALKLKTHLENPSPDMATLARLVESLPVTYPYLKDVITPYLDGTDVIGALRACYEHVQTRLKPAEAKVDTPGTA